MRGVCVLEVGKDREFPELPTLPREFPWEWESSIAIL